MTREGDRTEDVVKETPGRIDFNTRARKKEELP